MNDVRDGHRKDPRFIDKGAFVEELMKLGILGYDEQESLWDIGRRCAKKIGIPTGIGAWGYASWGANPAAATVFLGGLALGMATCSAVNLAHREQLRRLVRETKRGDVD